MRFEEVMEDVAPRLRSRGSGDYHHGGILALVSGLRDYNDVDRFFVDVRRGFGKPLIFGLEILVAADRQPSLDVPIVMLCSSISLSPTPGCEGPPSPGRPRVRT